MIFKSGAGTKRHADAFSAFRLWGRADMSFRMSRFCFLTLSFRAEGINWGWFVRRMVALGHSTLAREADEPTFA
jgi:hypothetical protein